MSSSSASEVTARSAKLKKHLNDILNGKRSVDSIAAAKLFIEAICDQKDAAYCVEKLVSNPAAVQCLRTSLRVALSPAFINEFTAPLLLYLSNPALKLLSGGQLVRHLLLVVVDPRTVWDAICQAFNDNSLTSAGVHAFAWLLSEILSAPDEFPVDVTDLAEHLTTSRAFLSSDSLDVRLLGNKIQHTLLTRTSPGHAIDSDFAPGGRHDNDFADFRKIAIIPTADEFACTTRPFYRPAAAIDEAEPEQRVAVHLDNQFRLLREDMLGELRNDLQLALRQKQQKKGQRAPAATMLRNLMLHGIDCGSELRRRPCALVLRCATGIPQLRNLPVTGRQAFLNDHKNFFRHLSFGCLHTDANEIVAFVTFLRDDKLLAADQPAVVVQVAGAASLQKTLLELKLSGTLHLVLVDTSVFAYEPILRCLQQMTALPLAEDILASSPSTRASLVCPPDFTRRIRESEDTNLQADLSMAKPVRLDKAQSTSLAAGLSQTLSLIQGPPGTGKSFIGALIAKIFHDRTREKLLIICYTNHALDQFLEDLLDAGIPPHTMTRLGAKSTPRTSCLSLFEQLRGFKRPQATWATINKLKDSASEIEQDLQSAFDTFLKSSIGFDALMLHLEFAPEGLPFFEALSTPVSADGMTTVAKRGKRVKRDYLLDQWCRNLDSGVFKDVAKQYPAVWGMDGASRSACLQRWRRAIIGDDVEQISARVQDFDSCQKRLSDAFGDASRHIISEKRIIGCTTTAAAKYSQELQNAAPGIILVEEAGEILESHVLTAMTPATKQLVLIGDHQQLRPKVSNFALSVEKGDGYDLNRSLFERLILAGYPHTTLTSQHRMCPEISRLVRHLTYPDLMDAPATLNRPPLRGLQDRVVFLNHGHFEAAVSEITDRRDLGSKASKQNAFEVDMVLKIVRYLAQQGYGTEKQVVLTPYLGQLQLLRVRLSKDNDPVLNDLDSHDLVRAGLLPPASAKLSKRSIRISTIDNYQGEESDIVVATLTRSNPNGDIGFLAAPERLNVLLSRARNALIMIGNADTLMKSNMGKKTWTPFFDILRQYGHLYDGFPTRCERHPDRKAILSRIQDFDDLCPEGGCSLPCGMKLSCGIHDCPQKCHQIADHSKMQCQKLLEDRCPKGHKLRWHCFAGRPGSCRACDTEERIEAEKRQRDAQLEAERQAKQQRYADELARVQADIARQRDLARNLTEDAERASVLAQHQRDLAEATAAVRKMRLDKEGAATPTPSSSATPAQLSSQRNEGTSVAADQKLPQSTTDDSESAVAPRPNAGAAKQPLNSSSPLATKKSAAELEWEHQKEFENARNSALDELMAMIGLEDVKNQFLAIKAKVDTAVRQNVSMKDERFGAALLGNPGTGKTTVARLYAKFLTSVGALPGSSFLETSGSRLANDGVAGCKKHIEHLLKDGGGALFIDEAYQLASGHSALGRQVLDFLLAEVENQTGKIVFILAGYNKQMEDFFAHNPGLPSRFPHELQFRDYSDAELLQILAHKIKKKYGSVAGTAGQQQSAMKIEDGPAGLYARIVARRVGRGRGRVGFGNARAVENALARIAERQAQRLMRERRTGKQPDDMLLTKDDLIGPEPAQVLRDNATWVRLQSLTGLAAVKQAVQVLVDTVQRNYWRELTEEPLLEFSLNRVFVGSPGTGKTTVAKLYGQILADMGLLSRGEVVVKNPSDFVGDVMGASEKITKGILASTVGKVLVIDEAYGLYGGGSGAGGSADIYRSAVIDTIVAEVQSTPGDDRCVLLLGYKDQMETMLQAVNPGLSRRFPLNSAFVFEDFTDAELRQVLDLKLQQQGFSATADAARDVAIEVLQRARNRPNFGNAGEVDILLDSAKMRQQQRLSSLAAASFSATRAAESAVGGGDLVRLSAILEPQDFDPEFDRAARGATNVRALFVGVVGSEDVIAKLEGYQRTVANMKARGMDPLEQIPFNFLFRGPPGTGKTSTARRMGKVYYDMGVLATAEVVECSASDLVGQYVGQTGPKTQQLLEKALGKVLFIDEAYRLADGGAGANFAKEAMDEMVDCLTKPKFCRKLVVILAGYDADINRLMNTNPGLTSRFPETISFGDLAPAECITLLTQTLARTAMGKHDLLDLTVVERPTTAFRAALLQRFAALAQLANWANARDVQTLARNVFGKLVRSATPTDTERLVVAEALVLEEIDSMLQERAHRATQATNTTPLDQALQLSRYVDAPLASRQLSAAHHSPSSRAEHAEEAQQDHAAAPPATVIDNASSDEARAVRDVGVNDGIWEQLQRDVAAEESRERTAATIVAEHAAALDEASAADRRDADAASQVTRKIEEAQRNGNGVDGVDERRRLAEELEQARIKSELERRAREMALAKLEQKRREVEEERRKEAVAQAKLRRMGVCPMGYRWIKQAGGYRCAGGSHWVTDAELSLEG